ncbi:MAG: hypothetical protein GX111_09180 [Clostridiales bacterium]|jgi:hypothetical protein|nr:hypothetical protein [Clostridiales bacterium]
MKKTVVFILIFVFALSIGSYGAAILSERPRETAPAISPAATTPPTAAPTPGTPVPQIPENNPPGCNRPDCNHPNQNAPDTNRSNMMQNKLNELQKKFDALSDKQRKEVYAITDELTSQFVALTKKYRDLGVLSKTEAAQITNVLQTGYEMAKKNGRILFALPPMH